jgi:hypothetical protein
MQSAQASSFNPSNCLDDLCQYVCSDIIELMLMQL